MVSKQSRRPRIDRSLSAADVRLGHGRFLRGQSRIDEAESVLAEALAIAEDYLPGNSPQLDRYRSPLD